MTILLLYVISKYVAIFFAYLFVALYSLHADPLIILIEAGNKEATTTMVALERYLWAFKIQKVSWGSLDGACPGYSPKVKGNLLHV